MSWLLQLSGKHVGLACRDGLFLDKRVVDKRDSANWAAGQRLLINRSVDAAVFENGAAMILGEGIAYDRCQVGIVTDAEGAESLADFDIHNAEQLYHVLRTQVDIVLPEGAAVLNAADPLVARMAELCDGDVIFYGLTQDLPAIAAHRARGGRALYLRENRIMLATGAVEGPLHGTARLSQRTRTAPTANAPPACWQRWAPPWRSTSRSKRSASASTPSSRSASARSAAAHAGWRTSNEFIFRKSIMEVTRIRALRGPNLWSRHTAIEAVVRTATAPSAPSAPCPASRTACARAFRTSARCTRSATRAISPSPTLSPSPPSACRPRPVARSPSAA